MDKIEIHYNRRTPEVIEAEEVVSGQRGTVEVQFSFSEEWERYPIRSASFSSSADEGTWPLEEDKVKIPESIIVYGVRSFTVSVFGLRETEDGKIERYNGKPAAFRVEIGGRVPGEGCKDADPSMYEVLLTAIAKKLDAYQGTENAGRVLVVGEDGTVVPGEAKGNVELDTTLTQSGKAADAKAVGDALAEQGKTIPKVFDWAKAELPITEKEISGVASGGGFVVNPTNFADGKTYFRYHAGSTYGFRWENPNKQKGSLTITVRGYSQYSTTLSTGVFVVYTDGTESRIHLTHGETVTYTTDPNKTVDYIRGNYDFENWVLLDMDVLSIVADYPAPTGTVKSVNGILPDENGNVQIPVSDGALVEPAEDDIPKVFFGGALQQTKDEAVVPFRYISKTEDVSGYAEIKAQGNSSMSYPKKNQTVKLYKDEACTEKLKIDFKGWGKQSKFCFKANWIDLTHARNVVSARLWGDVVKSRANYEELPELLRTSPNQGAVNGFPVKVYANGVYQGRYTANIPKDAWMANMDDELDTHCILCGENYVSGCFRAAANINGSDWTDEVHDTVPASIKTRWNEVISFVMNSTDEEFKNNLDSYFYVDSLIDYYLFGLVSCGLDAFGKNQLYMTYNGQKWIATMYDMDSTWGLWWNGASFVATDYDRSEYQDFKDGAGNLLFIRLEELFCEAIKTRWEDLKHGALSIENIINRFERFTDIAPAELVKEDYASTTGGGKFTGIPSQSTNNIQQIRAYANARLAWTDEYVAALTGGEVDPDEPDEPVVPDEPVTGSLLYSLPEATTFNGTSDYIDTGVKLFDTNKDFTILLDFEDVYTASASNKYVLHCVHEATPYPGVSVWISNDEYRMTGAGKLGFKSISDGRFRVAVTKDAASGVITAKCIYGTDTATSANVTSAILDETVLLGVKKNADGSLDSASYWGGTIYQCDIYDYKFTDAEISAHILEKSDEQPVTYEETVLYENYSPNGVAFIEDVDIDFAAGDYIEASIDTSAVTGVTTVFSVGTNIAAWSSNGEYNYHFCVSAGKDLQFNATANGGNAARTTLSANDQIIVKVDRRGIWCNNGLLALSGIPETNEKYTLIKDKMLELSTVQVGAAEGNVKSVATYNYIKVCRALQSDLPDLPSGYTAVEYIQSDGNQYTDTGVSGGTNAAWEIKMNALGAVATSWETYICGAKNGTIPNLYFGLNNRIESSNASGPGNSLNALDYGVHTYEYRGTKNIYVDGEPYDVVNDPTGNGWGTSTWYVFNSHGEPHLKSSMRLYYFKMWTDGVLVRDFVPAVRNSDNSRGLYDLANDVFYGNIGTGAFLIPDEVEGDTGVKLIYNMPEATTFNGTSDYIDTGVPLMSTAKNMNICIDCDFSDCLNNSTIFHCKEETSPYNGISLAFNDAGNYGVVQQSTRMNGIPTGRRKIVIRFVRGCMSYVKYSDGGIIKTIEQGGTYGATDRNLLIGCHLNAQGNKVYFWTGTIYDFKVYEGTMTDDEIGAYLNS